MKRPSSPRHLSPESPVGETVLKGLAGVALLEEGVRLEVSGSALSVSWLLSEGYK